MMPKLIRRTWQADLAGQGPRSARQAFDYEAFVPDPIASFTMTFSADLVQAMSAAEKAAEELQREPHAPGLDAFGRLLLRSESIASSFIEGLQVSPRKVAEATLFPDAASAATREVLGNIRAMERAIAEAAAVDRISVGDLATIHRTLFEGTHLAGIAGKIRNKQNWIGGDEYSPRRADFIPPPEGLVPGLLDDLCTFMNRDDFPAIAQAAVAHAQFETIHPFGDGNGRVGRALIHVILKRRSITPRRVPPVSIALASNPRLYVAGLRAFGNGDQARWCHDFSEALEWASRIALALTRRIRGLQERWQRELRPRANSAQAKLIMALPEIPVLDVKTAATTAGVSAEAARLAVLELEKAGVLTPSMLGKQRHRVWRAAEVLESLHDAEEYLKDRGS